MPEARNTMQRKLVLDTVRALRNHPTAEEIYKAIARRYDSISRATVYRNLNFLAQRGEIRRVSHLNAADRFDFELTPHYHFRCTRCGNVFDIDYPYQEDFLSQVQSTKGFELEGYEITFSGRCLHCMQSQKN